MTTMVTTHILPKIGRQMASYRLPATLKCIARYFTVILILYCTTGYAQWDFDLTADLGIAYTDNFRLVSDGSEEDEVVYTIIPTFTLTNEGERLTADLRYRPEAYLYNEAPEGDSVFHVVDASLTTAFIRDAFFVYLSGVRFQTIDSPDGIFPTSNLPIAGNRVDSTVVEIRPYWEQSLGFAEILAEVTYIDSGFDKEIQNQNGGLIQDNIEKSALFNLNNHSNQSGVAWGIGYEYQRIEYDRAIPFEYQAASADLGYWVNGATRLFVSGGIETPFDSYFDASLEDDFWEAGFQYTPNQRLNIELAAGERSFGNTIRARASYQLRRGSTEFTYEEGATTRGALGTSRRPILETDNLDSLLDGPGLGDRFVRKHGNWISTIELAKSDISVRLFSEQRDQRTTGAGGVLDDERVVGAALRWEWRLGVNSTVGLASNIARREVGTMESDLKRFSFDYAFRFSQRLSLVFLAQHANDSGDITVAGIYTENQYRLNLRVQL